MKQASQIWKMNIYQSCCSESEQREVVEKESDKALEILLDTAEKLQ